METLLMPFIIPLKLLSPAYGSLSGGGKLKKSQAAGAEQTCVVEMCLPKGLWGYELWCYTHDF